MQTKKIKARLILALGISAALGALCTLPGQPSPDPAGAVMQIGLAALLGSGLGVLLAARLLSPVEKARQQTERQLHVLLDPQAPQPSTSQESLPGALELLQRTLEDCLQDIRQQALSLGRGEFSARIERSHPGLFGQACRSLNGLALQLAELAQRQREEQLGLQQTIDMLNRDKAALRLALDEHAQRGVRALALSEARCLGTLRPGFMVFATRRPPKS